MPARTYARGLLFWTDDNLEGRDFPEDIWTALFGNHSDRVFRLMDLSLEIATSYESAMEKLDSFDSYDHAGTFIFCVVDLSIPRRAGMQAENRWGVSLARELRAKGLAFAFLSSNTDGTRILDQARLSTMPYHVKEPGGVWRFPKTLVLNLLSELRRRVSWVSVQTPVAAMHESSEIRSSFRVMERAFRFFPYFGPFREYVDRCEYRQAPDIGPMIAVRSARLHCDQFVQQALSIMLFPRLLQKPGTSRVYYGGAHEPKYLDLLQQTVVRSDPDGISVIRVTPEHTTGDQLADTVRALGLRAGQTVFVLPNDESVDTYIELLRGLHIPVTEELPQIRQGDLLQREELIRHCCVLSLHAWMEQRIAGEPVRLERGSLTHPELLINPIYWAVLHETTNIPEELSDPFEIVLELGRVLESMTRPQYASIRAALTEGRPVPYRHLLKVGHDTLMASEYSGVFPSWIEQTLDAWLKSSWQQPYGITDSAGRSERRGEDETERAVAAMERWQDSCFEVLVGILAQHKRYEKQRKNPTSTQASLDRVGGFVSALGGAEFISADIDSVNWDELALMRWPHRQYPLPSVILRRLREAGRYLWIQPEGLDIATALPAGRQRYRMLSSMVDQYWSTLTWTKSIAPYLPRGWQASVAYLTEIIAEHQISSAWSSDRREVWGALLTLLRNGGPITFIADRLVQGTLVTGGSESAKDYLSKVQGYGTILNRIRGSRHRRVGGYLERSLRSSLFDSDLSTLAQSAWYLGQFAEDMPDRGDGRANELLLATRAILAALVQTRRTQEEGSTHNPAEIGPGLALVFSDCELGLTAAQGWYLDEFKTREEEFYAAGDSPSLFGTKADYLWKALDTLFSLDHVTRGFRYFDGYHLLATLNELRVVYKDSHRPDAPLPVIETIMDLFVASIQGLVAQLAWCVEAAGFQELADPIKPPVLSVQAPTDISLPSRQQLSEVLRVRVTERGWEVYTLGIPGSGTVDKLCYEDMGTTTKWQNP